MPAPTRRPPQRYGDRSPDRRLIALLLVVALVAVGGALWWMAQVADQPVRASLSGWDLPEGDTMTATVEIARHPDTAVTCELVAVDNRMIVVGQIVEEIPAGPEQHLEVPVEIPVQGDAVAAELRGCEPSGSP